MQVRHVHIECGDKTSTTHPAIDVTVDVPEVSNNTTGEVVFNSTTPGGEPLKITLKL